MTRLIQHFSVALALVMAGPTLAAEIAFDRDVRPILAEHCFACHGPDAAAREADLRLDIRDTVTLSPSADEIHDLAERADDPIISRVATELVRLLEAGGDAAADAREAVNILHGLCSEAGRAAR